MNELACIILAAGKGKRMNNPDIPKVMVSLAGKPLIGHVLTQVTLLHPAKTLIIVGHHKEHVISYVKEEFPWADCIEQAEQLGTGHAVKMAEHALENFYGDVLIITGDTPLLRSETLDSFVEEHQRYRGMLSGCVLSAVTPNPKGYGRIVRSPVGEFMKIVEEKDATDEEKLVTEINTGIFVVKAVTLFAVLKEISNSNAQGEYYLTDIVELIRRKGMSISAIKAENFDEFRGINTPEDLARAEDYYYMQRLNKLL
jgi:UDP-N-acetylglucosamine diphosphorylase/glucosamine-1-phosphate N-acetyltransferase